MKLPPMAMLLLIASMVMSLCVATTPSIVLCINEDKRVSSLPYSSPREDNEFVIVTVAMKNNGYPEYYLSPYDFKIVTEQMVISPREATRSLLELGYKPLNNSVLSPGQSVLGHLVFEVPKEAVNIRFRYYPYRDANVVWCELDAFRGSDTDTTITINTTTRHMLAEIALPSESCDDIIRRLMREAGYLNEEGELIKRS